MRIMGTSFFLGIMATIILGITLLSIAIYDIVCHRIRHVIKYLFVFYSYGNITDNF